MQVFVLLHGLLLPLADLLDLVFIAKLIVSKLDKLLIQLLVLFILIFVLFQRLISHILSLTEPCDLELLSLPGSVLPLRISCVQVSDEIKFLLLKFLAHLKELILPSLLLLKAAPDIFQKIFVSCLALDLLDFDLPDLIFELLGLDLVERSPVLLPLSHLLLKDVPFQVDGGVCLLQLLESVEGVHSI